MTYEELCKARRSDLVVEVQRLQQRLQYLEPFLASSDGYAFCHHCKDHHRLDEEHRVPVLDPSERV